MAKLFESPFRSEFCRNDDVVTILTFVTGKFKMQSSRTSPVPFWDWRYLVLHYEFPSSDLIERKYIHGDAELAG